MMGVTTRYVSLAMEIQPEGEDEQALAGGRWNSRG
jgi:hypothetical protein